MNDILSTLFGGSSNNFGQPGGYSPIPGGNSYNTQLDSLFGSTPAAMWSPSSAAGSGVSSPTFMQNMLGYTQKDGTKVNGWGGMALGAMSSLGNAMMAKKQYGLARDSLKENMRQYNQNFAAQRKMVNSQLEDRQRARVASNPNEYESVGSYMSRNGV